MNNHQDKWFSRISIITTILSSGEYFVFNSFFLDIKICTSKKCLTFGVHIHTANRITFNAYAEYFAFNGYNNFFLIILDGNYFVQ